MFAYVLAFIFIYLHIFPLFVDGNRWDVESEREKWRVGEVGGNDLLQSEFLFLSNFMVSKVLFWFEQEMSVLWGILSDD